MGKATDRCRSSILILGFAHPHFLLIHSKIRELYVETEAAGETMSMNMDGRITINPKFVDTLDRNKLAGVLAHEMLHLVLNHIKRASGKDGWVWNVAADMVINQALKNDAIELPNSALFPPNEYDGDLYTEAVYDWLRQHPDKVPPKPAGSPMPGAGCAPTAGTGAPGVPDWRQTGIEARAMASQAGKGTGGVAGLLAPRVAKVNWRNVLRSGFQKACSRPGHEHQSWSRRNRRSPADGVQFPGWIGSSPSVAISLDVSGSMSPDWISKMVAEIKHLLTQFPGVKCYLNAHTSDVVYASWITDRSANKVVEATKFTGGTDPSPAYVDIKNAGKFDSLVHFTDTEFFSQEWPEVPARHLIVGMFRHEPSCKPPPGSTVIQCATDD